jgi:hypothetical protein
VYIPDELQGWMGGKIFKDNPGGRVFRVVVDGGMYRGVAWDCKELEPFQVSTRGITRLSCPTHTYRTGSESSHSTGPSSPPEGGMLQALLTCGDRR